MAQFNNTILTDRGFALQNKVEAGLTALNFTRCAVGDGMLPTGTELQTLTDLINRKAYIPLNRVSLVNGKAVVRLVITNQNLVEGYYLREIGIFANDPDLGEILYAVANAGETADLIPPYGGLEIVENYFDAIVIIGNAESVTAIIDDSLVYITRQEFEEHTNYKVYNPNGAHGFKTSVNPGAAENGKFLKYDHSVQKHVYSGIKVVKGTAAHGATIPIPDGYTAEQCVIIVSMQDSNPTSIRVDIPENGPRFLMRTVCSVDVNRVVTAQTIISNTSYDDGTGTTTIDGIATYTLIAGVI